MPERTMAEITAWARRNWPGGDPGPLAAEIIPADGSPRKFVRLGAGGQNLVALSSPENPAENRAWRYLAGHLQKLGLPAAEVLAAQVDEGLFLMRDLGRVSLQQAARSCQGDIKALTELYAPVLALLARLQAQGAAGFDPSICFDGAELSGDFLLEREAGYFLREFVAGACGLAEARWPDGLETELAEICSRAGRAQPRGLVHRDFQSRNILVRDDGLGLVDFQGARLGPAQYDLAALLNDPYVDLPWGLRGELRERYLDMRNGLGEFDRNAFKESWPFVAACRAMQTLGAFAFLTRVRGRRHFAVYVAPALATLRALGQDPALACYAALQDLVSTLPAEPDKRAFTPPNLVEEK